MKILLATTTALTLTAFAGCAEAGPVNTADKAQVESIIKSYLMENPEIIRDAMIELEKKEDRAMMAAVSDEMKSDPRDASIGPENAKVTIVEFFDYNCGYCKKSTDWVMETVKAYPKDVRVVFKELPILDGRTKTSRNAALAALAADRQGKYQQMHVALMNGRSLTPERIDKIAADLGLDVKKMREDMKDAALEKHLEDTLNLAQRVPPLTGTPFFVINDEYMAGANTDRLEEMLKIALAG